MVEYKIVYDKEVAKKDIAHLKAARLDKKAKDLIDVLREDPFRSPPSFEKLVGDLKGLYSRRINIKHRLVYQVFEEEKVVRILNMWTHYEK